MRFFIINWVYIAPTVQIEMSYALYLGRLQLNYIILLTNSSVYMISCLNELVLLTTLTNLNNFKRITIVKLAVLFNRAQTLMTMQKVNLTLNQGLIRPTWSKVYKMLVTYTSLSHQYSYMSVTYPSLSHQYSHMRVTYTSLSH